jgi:hypothetical protein
MYVVIFVYASRKYRSVGKLYAALTGDVTVTQMALIIKKPKLF